MKQPELLRLDAKGPQTSQCNNCKRTWSADFRSFLDEFLFYIPNKKFAQVVYFVCPLCRHLAKLKQYRIGEVK